MSDEPPAGAARQPDDARFGDVDTALERLTFFSDAVIAIAMTLLVLDLRLPTGETDIEQWRSFGDHLWVEYFPFVLSFVLIAFYWANHHRFFTHVARVGPGLIPTSMLFLFSIVVLPFATRMIAEDGDFQLGTVFYAAVMILVVVSMALVVQCVWRQGLQAPGTPIAVRDDITHGLVTAAIIFALSIPIAFVSVAAAKYFWLALLLDSDAAKALYRKIGGRKTADA